ncbi:MAG: heme-binding protein [Gammaproteobacteria bacterium]|nr:heme-binding protein [Gammaproteobacteria bacterium]
MGTSSHLVLAIILTLLLCACGGGGGGGSVAAEQSAVNAPVVSGTPATCADNCFLSATDVEQIIGQAVAEASQGNARATIAVVDRVGNVLGVFQMSGADEFITVTSTAQLGGPIVGGLESLNFIPASLAAIAKAVTGAYLSTSGNAFTTRTASQIIQENFNPGERDVPSGPLFGVQFSQLPCSDFSQRFTVGVGPGPHRSPLGLSADPGGLPLYIDGVAVGGVGIIADGIYGLDKDITDFDNDLDEILATAATVGYAAPLEIRADQITIVGKTARYSDFFVEGLSSSPGDSLGLETLAASGVGSLLAVPGYFDGTATLSGTVFGNSPSGIRPADPEVFINANGESLDAFVFVDAGNQNRFPATDATDEPGGDPANRLTAEEVQTILNEAIDVANQSRAQIRVPVGTQARVTVSIVDTAGNIVGMGRTRDGPVFGADVSLQKARTATFFSGTGRTDGQAPADLLRALPDPIYMRPLPEPINLADLGSLDTPDPRFSDYVTALQLFLGDPGALESTGANVAFADRSGGNLSRPNYPDGPADGPPGPLSKPPGEWSIFSDGLQLDLVYNSVIQHVAFVLGAVGDVPQNCTGNTGFADTDPFTVINSFSNLPNGIQIFPGSVPIYRGNTLVGGVGVSGDGVDQDDMISFLGLHRAGLRLNTGVGNAPPEIRADTLDIPNQSSRLRYVNCPQLPFINNSDTEVCNGI